ncbi:MAG TPA: hypothetical protein VIV65_04140 [Gemmatimonadaceae bacterium]|jgi:hypothetical protein
MKSLTLATALILVACRVEKVRTPDTTSVANEPGPGVSSCGITTESRVREDGLGVLRIGMSIDAVRANCSVLSERSGANDARLLAMVDLGKDTAAVEFVSGVLRRITLHHQAYRTPDSVGVGTHISTILSMPAVTAITERGRLYAVSPAYCGLRFMLMDPAPTKPVAQSGKAALRRLEGETRTLELEITGCQRRR